MAASSSSFAAAQICPPECSIYSISAFTHTNVLRPPRGLRSIVLGQGLDGLVRVPPKY